MLQADAICQSADSLIGASEAPRAVDLGHLCRDIVALIDLDRRFGICFPTCKVMADPTILELLLRLLLENAAKHAHHTILVTLAEAGSAELRFQVLHDGAAESAVQRGDGTAIIPPAPNITEVSDLGRARNLVESLGGELTECSDSAGLVGTEFKLSGALMEEAVQRGVA